MKTPLQRQQGAEKDFWTLLYEKNLDRDMLSDAMHSVLSTAQSASSPPGARPSGNHVGFAEQHVEFFRDLMIKMVDAIRVGTDPKLIYANIVTRTRPFGLALTPDPWDLSTEAKAA